MEFLKELEYRGLVKDVTDYEGLTERLKSPVKCYCGFDPTADSLHIGHLQQLLLLKRYQNAGHTPVALCGGATGMIGDPRPTTERKLQTLDQIAYNVECLKKQISNFIDFEGENPAILVNNFDWLSKINILEFLRDYGKHFNINYMISKDIVSSRLEKGISFTEFTYTILQAADWLHLYQNYNCELQIGGSDQWGNLTSGTELIRKVCGDKAKVFGITSPLIMKSDGTKFGKSEGGNIWLDPTKTSAYEFYQFWLNVADVDVINFIKRLSFMPVEKIEELVKSVEVEPHLRAAQKALAFELTELVHGKQGVESALKITQTLFNGNIMDLSIDEIKEGLSDAPKFELNESSLLIDVLVNAKITSSKREAREFISKGSITINGEKITDLEFMVEKSDAINEQLTIIKRGKKNYFVITF